MTWDNKIVANTTESPDQLLAHYANPRRHNGRQRDAMRASLDELGIIAPCTVNDRTGNMIDGHMRTEEYLTKGVEKVPVIHLDLTEEEELKAIAYFDAVGTLATYDEGALEALLQQIDFESEALENLLADISLTTQVYDFEQKPGQNKEIDIEELREGMEHVCPRCKFQF